jgi:exopolyphosphatase/guanosine-5'-triphosphate,3'-diphosphate pyrophosphatase
MPGLQPERADVIAAGALVVEHLMSALRRTSLVVSEADLLWAVVLNR